MQVALGILVDGTGRTVGARLLLDGQVRDLSTAELVQCVGLSLDNAVVDKNGYVRAKSGRLKRINKDVGKGKLARMDYASTQRLLRESELVLYHGNKDKGMRPRFGVGGSSNDFGSGFYTTPDVQLAKEWAWSRYTQGLRGYVHAYRLDFSGLNVLDFCSMDSLYWVAEIVSNRAVNLMHRDVARQNRDKFVKWYKLDTSPYDLIVGYRADDSYFDYVTDFVAGVSSREMLERALHLGNLGLQVCVKSRKAFSLLQAVSVEEVPKKYGVSYREREARANADYKQLMLISGKGGNLHTIMDYIQ